MKKFLSIIIVGLFISQNVFAVTRFYFPGVSTNAQRDFSNTSPAWSGSWANANGNDTIQMSPKNGNTASTTRTGAPASADGSYAFIRFISRPLQAQTISGTFKGTVRVGEGNVSDNFVNIVVIVRTIIAGGISIGATNLVDFNTYVPANTFSTTLTNRRIADGDSVNTISVGAGDRLDVELGFKRVSGTSAQSQIYLGENNSIDCADDEVGTTPCNGFIEFSQDILFEPKVTVLKGGIFHGGTLK